MAALILEAVGIDAAIAQFVEQGLHLSLRRFSPLAFGFRSLAFGFRSLAFGCCSLLFLIGALLFQLRLLALPFGLLISEQH